MNILQRIIDAILRLLRPDMTADEVAKALDARNVGSTEQLDWRHSIVDLLKLLKIDSGLEARKALAVELGYDGDLDGSGAMNLWLHREVMERVAARGISIPR